MFGQTDDMQNQSTQSSVANPALPPSDGTLGAPMNGVDDMAVTATASEDSDMPAFEPTAAPGDMATTAARGMANTPDELISIKQEALQSLKPLVGHLEQSPEEKFRTTMMMIQASDDQSLIPDAYDAAKAIDDEKARAQALLDVVNEINYFTAQNKQ